MAVKRQADGRQTTSSQPSGAITAPILPRKNSNVDFNGEAMKPQSVPSLASVNSAGAVGSAGQLTRTDNSDAFNISFFNNLKKMGAAFSFHIAHKNERGLKTQRFTSGLIANPAGKAKTLSYPNALNDKTEKGANVSTGSLSSKTVSHNSQRPNGSILTTREENAWHVFMNPNLSLTPDSVFRKIFSFQNSRKSENTANAGPVSTKLTSKNSTLTNSTSSFSNSPVRRSPGGSIAAVSAPSKTAAVVGKKISPPLRSKTSSSSPHRKQNKRSTTPPSLSPSPAASPLFSLLTAVRSLSFSSPLSKIPYSSFRERLAIMEGTLLLSSNSVITPPVSRNPNFSFSGNSNVIRCMKPESVSKNGKYKSVRVDAGDTLADIAKCQGMSIRRLQRLNGLASDVIYEGDMLVVSGKEDRHWRELPQIRSGIRRTCRPLFSRLNFVRNVKGRAASGRMKGVHNTLGHVNLKLLGVGGPERSDMSEGRWMRGPKGFQKPNDGWRRFNSPVLDGYISSPFGWRWGAMHEGVDLAANTGSPILASDKGIITFAGWNGGYGKLVTVLHDGGFSTRYGHCDDIITRVGQRVSRGQQVATVGMTGKATGPHVHFEVRKNGEALDPFKWCNL